MGDVEGPGEWQFLARDYQLLARDYQRLRLMTPDPVLVSFETVFGCNGASPETLNRYGIHAGANRNYMNELAADPASQHRFVRGARRTLEAARERIIELLCISRRRGIACGLSYREGEAPAGEAARRNCSAAGADDGAGNVAAELASDFGVHVAIHVLFACPTTLAGRRSAGAAFDSRQDRLCPLIRVPTMLTSSRPGSSHDGCCPHRS